MSMPELTKVEKVAGRLFRDTQQAALLASFETDPPTYTVLPWHKIYRHPCPARGDISTALELHEQYVQSGYYSVHVMDGELQAEEVDGSEVPGPTWGNTEFVMPGRFGFIYKQGQCRGCKAVARSKTGRLVDAIDRPPLEGRIAR
jgi:hypothetical protein